MSDWRTSEAWIQDCEPQIPHNDIRLLNKQQILQLQTTLAQRMQAVDLRLKFVAANVTEALPMFASMMSLQGPHPSVVLVVDTSGSMYDAWPFVKAEIRRSLHRLPSNCLINIVTFNSTVSQWQPRGVACSAANIADACTWLDACKVGGSTRTLEALKLAFEDPNVSEVCLLTDGLPDSGPDAVLDGVESLNANFSILIHTILFATYNSHASDYLTSLASANRGTYKEFSAAEIASCITREEKPGFTASDVEKLQAEAARLHELSLLCKSRIIEIDAIERMAEDELRAVAERMRLEQQEHERLELQQLQQQEALLLIQQQEQDRLATLQAQLSLENSHLQQSEHERQQREQQQHQQHEMVQRERHQQELIRREQRLLLQQRQQMVDEHASRAHARSIQPHQQLQDDRHHGTAGIRSVESAFQTISFDEPVEHASFDMVAVAERDHIDQFLEEKIHVHQQEIDDAMSALVGIRVLALSISSHRYHEGVIEGHIVGSQMLVKTGPEQYMHAEFDKLIRVDASHTLEAGTYVMACGGGDGVYNPAVIVNTPVAITSRVYNAENTYKVRFHNDFETTVQAECIVAIDFTTYADVVEYMQQHLTTHDMSVLRPRTGTIRQPRGASPLKARPKTAPSEPVDRPPWNPSNVLKRDSDLEAYASSLDASERSLDLDEASSDEFALKARLAAEQQSEQRKLRFLAELDSKNNRLKHKFVMMAQRMQSHQLKMDHLDAQYATVTATKRQAQVSRKTADVERSSGTALRYQHAMGTGLHAKLEREKAEAERVRVERQKYDAKIAKKHQLLMALDAKRIEKMEAESSKYSAVISGHHAAVECNRDFLRQEHQDRKQKADDIIEHKRQLALSREQDNVAKRDQEDARYALRREVHAAQTQAILAREGRRHDYHYIREQARATASRSQPIPVTILTPEYTVSQPPPSQTLADKAAVLHTEKRRADEIRAANVEVSRRSQAQSFSAALASKRENEEERRAIVERSRILKTQERLAQEARREEEKQLKAQQCLASKALLNTQRDASRREATLDHHHHETLKTSTMQQSRLQQLDKLHNQSRRNDAALDTAQQLHRYQQAVGTGGVVAPGPNISALRPW